MKMKNKIINFQIFILFMQLLYCILKPDLGLEIFIFPLIIVGLNLYSSSLKN